MTKAGGASLPGVVVGRPRARAHRRLQRAGRAARHRRRRCRSPLLSLRHPSRLATPLREAARTSSSGCPGSSSPSRSSTSPSATRSGILYESPAAPHRSPTRSCSSRSPSWRCGPRSPSRRRASRRWPARSAAPASRCFRRVTLPLVAPGLAVGFCLVFLEAVTELTATLVLIPPAPRRSPPSSGRSRPTGSTARRRCTRR